jgi:hypothetical protein
MSKTFQCKHGTVCVDSWQPLDLTVASIKLGEPFYLKNHEERIFEAVHIFAEPNHRFNFDERLKIVVSGCEEFNKRAGLFVAANELAKPELLPLPIHVGGSEWFAVYAPRGMHVVLYGWYHRPWW